MEKKADGKKKQASVNNREFAVVAYCFIGLFLCTMAYFAYFQVAKSEEFINNPYNARQETFEQSVVRGKILSAEREILAETIVNEDGEEQRVYPYFSLFSHAVGYATKEYGRSGVESWENFNLLRSNAFFLEKTVKKATDEKCIGDNVITTLNVSIQNAAYLALGNYNGAIVVMEPATGKILAMVSKPDFDPNRILEDWDSIVKDENSDSALLNRASQGLYPPGSTFKTVTLLEYMREHREDYEDYAYACQGSIQEGNSKLRCFNGEIHGMVDLKRSFVKSCNTSFANIGLSLDADRFSSTCKELLFQESLPVDKLDTSKSSFVLDGGSSKSEIMETAIGQGKTLVTPLHMLMITSAIANDGILMEPYMVQATETYEEAVVKTHDQTEYGRILTEEEAGILKEYMRETVESGTASQLKGSEYQAYGKTGSAEFGSNKGDSHAWFIGYAHREDKEDIAIAVIMEGAGSGSRYAVPAAKSVLDAYYQ